METKKVKIDHNKSDIKAHIKLKGSKSISNRVLIMRALAGGSYALENLSESADTHTLVKLLEQKDETVYDAGLAGTTFRFMTAFLALKEGVQELTGVGRMLERPIGPLVKALNKIGCNITYLNKKGYPPLQINSPDAETGGTVDIRGDISSQFLSALLLIGPYTTKGININIKGELVSRPYLEMTINLIRAFGGQIELNDNSISVSKGSYIEQDFYVEGDWSSASYIYEVAAISEKADITITGLTENSLQGDSMIARYAEKFGLETKYADKAVHITKAALFKPAEMLEFDLIEQPDLCQTIVCMCAAKGISANFTGLKTLRIKETDRIKALRIELDKMNVSFNKLPSKFSEKTGKEYFLLEGKIEDDPEFTPIKTYHDHRMAMAFAPLALLRPIKILDPEVVVKSYPDYWGDLKALGFEFLGKH